MPSIELLNISYYIVVIGWTQNSFLLGEGKSRYIHSLHIYFTFVYMLTTIHVIANQLEHIYRQIYVCICHIWKIREIRRYTIKK